MRIGKRQLSAALTVLVLSSCAKATVPAPLSIDGTWSANLTGVASESGSGVMTWTLTQAGTTVTGTGTFKDATDPGAAIMSVTGTSAAEGIVLVVQVLPQVINGQTVDANKPPMGFAGTRDDATTISGSLGGASPSAGSVQAVFKRQ
jgi:hypothetical protein